MNMNWFPSALRNWGATATELTDEMTGDGLVWNPKYTATMAITIDASPESVWPWLTQIGYRRGGLYSYDWLDRVFGFLDGPSADRILPAFKQLKVGDVIPIGGGGGWPVVLLEPHRLLVLGGAERGVEWTWAFGLRPLGAGRTRLVSKNRVFMPDTVGNRMLMLILAPAAFLMTRKMLIGIKQRVENVANSPTEDRRHRLAS